MEHDERIPGVTFRLTRGDQKPPIDPKKQKAIGVVELHAEINDFNVWAAVLDRLNGMRIYTVENLAEEMVDVAQKKAREVEQQMQAKTDELHTESQQALQSLSFAKQENVRLQAVLHSQEQELQRLRQVEAELRELEGAVHDVNYAQALLDKGNLR